MDILLTRSHFLGLHYVACQLWRPLSPTLLHLIIAGSNTADTEPWHTDLTRQTGHMGHLLHNSDRTNDHMCPYMPTSSVCHQSFDVLWFIYLHFLDMTIIPFEQTYIYDNLQMFVDPLHIWAP